MHKSHQRLALVLLICTILLPYGTFSAYSLPAAASATAPETTAAAPPSPHESDASEDPAAPDALNTLSSPAPANTTSPPTEIATADDFLELAHQSGSFILTDDIDFHGQRVAPISGFTGHFDGGGHTISNFEISGDGTVGLFSALSEGYIGNLTLENYKLSNAQSGVLAGTIKQTGGEQLTIENITLGEGEYNQNGTFLGGIASLVYQNGAGCQLTVRSIQITGDDVASRNTASYAGGIFSYVNQKKESSGSSITISDVLIADLDESTPGSSDTHYPMEAVTVGGVIGRLIANADAAVHISNVTVADSVKLKSSDYGGAAIGYLEGTHSQAAVILDNIIMEGRITGSWSGNFVGGASSSGALTITNSLGAFAAQYTTYSGGAIGYATAGNIEISNTAFVANTGSYSIPGLLSTGSKITATETNCARLSMPRSNGATNQYYTVDMEGIGGNGLVDRLSINYLPPTVNPDAYIADEQGWKFPETGKYAIYFEVCRDQGIAAETKLLAGGCNFDLSVEVDENGATHIHGNEYTVNVDGEKKIGRVFTIPDLTGVRGANGCIVLEGDEFMADLRADLAQNNPDGKSSNTNCAYWEEHADGALKFVNDSGEEYVVTGWELDTLNDEYNSGSGPDYDVGDGSGRPQGCSATEAYGFDGVRIPYNLTVNRAITPMLSGSEEDLKYDSVLYKDLMAENYADSLLAYYKKNCTDPSHSCQTAQAIAELDESHIREIFGGTEADVYTENAFSTNETFDEALASLQTRAMFQDYGWVNDQTFWMLESDPELVKLAYDRFYQNVLMFTLDDTKNPILPAYDDTYVPFKHPPILDPAAPDYTGNPDSNYWADYMDKSSDEARWIEQYGFGSMEFDAAGENVYEFDNVAMRIRGESYTNGYAYRSTPEFNFNDTEMGNWPGKLTFRIYLQPADYKEAVTLTPVDITGYTGGDSMSDDSFPAIRYEITAPTGVDVENLTFSADGQTGTAIQAGSYYVIPALSNTFTLQETDAQAAADNDGKAGTYDIGVANAITITASTGGTNYNVVVADSGKLTVRYVSEPEEVLESNAAITTPVVTDEGQVNTQNGMAMAVIENGATFYTNGQNKNLGIVGTNATDGSNAQISLLFDDILELKETVGEDEDAVQLLISRANAVQSGVTFTSGQYEFKYMDLVNANDGNAWVSTDKDITVYWPYPDAVKRNYADYTFQVVHFQGLHRESYAADSNGVVEQISKAPVEVLSTTPTEHGVKFTLAGNAEAGSFSPFALVWAKEGSSTPSEPSNPDPIYYTLHYESNGGTAYDDERYRPNTFVTLDKVPVREGYTFTGWYADEALTEKITDVTMNRDRTVYAGWEPTGVPEWLNGDDHFAYVIGYPDGTVRPLGQITRAEVATIFFRLLKEEVRSENLATENPFSDVTTKNWFHTAVSTMTALGIVQGRTADTFVPNAPITRAEFAAICARFDTGHTDGDSSFTDIAGHWAEAEIERAATLGWIMGYEDGTFRPDRPITRAEAMTLINRVLNRLPQDESDLLEDMNIWPDNQPGDWYYLSVQEATNTHDFLRKGEIYETWTRMLEDPDWVQYETTS